MKYLNLLIIFPLIYSGYSFPSLFNITLSFPNISLPNISMPKINWEFDFDFGKYLNQLKSATPEYITKIQKRIYEFIKKTDEEKEKNLDILSEKVKESYNKVKTGIKKGSENIKNETKELIETITETAKTLSYKFDDTKNYAKEQYIKKKKIIFNNIMQIVDENFGQCSKIVNEIHNLSDNIEFNIKYFLFLVISLTENFDSIQKGMSHIIFDIINCLQEKFPNIWPEISDTVNSRVNLLNIKQDLINLLAKSISNLVTFSKYEEALGYIDKIENVTGFKITENAQKIYKNMFNILKRFNEFGTQTYNISTNLNLNVFRNNENSQLIKHIDYKDKGIIVNVHLSYMLKNFKVHSVQAVVFDSPLVSFKAERKSKGGISNIFVGITLYDKDGNEIYVKDIKLDKIEILFKKSLYKSMKTCLYYNEDKNIMDNNGINTEYVEFGGIEYIKCIPKHLSSFTIGSLEKEEEEFKISKNILKYSAINIGILFIALLCSFYIFRSCNKKRSVKTSDKINVLEFA